MLTPHNVHVEGSMAVVAAGFVAGALSDTTQAGETARRAARSIEGPLSRSRKAPRYWASKARRAASMVGPKPAIPSRTLRPRSAIQMPERTKILGERTAEGLVG